MIEAVAKFISEHRLLKAGERVGVAVSGGADSVALLRVLLELRGELGVVLAAVHFNHRIRGAESDADERFVRELAAKFELEFLYGSADVPAFASEHGMGLEAAARKLRYEYLATLLWREEDSAPSKFTLDKIATAHTENDQAETVLIRLMRGAGTRGLGGIQAKLEDIGVFRAGIGQTRAMAEGDAASYVSTGDVGAGCVIRPLLGVTRKEVISYLDSLHQPWREDSSNRQLEHTRNRVRHELIPLLERNFNPAIVHVLAEHAQIAQAEEEFWATQAEQALLAVSNSEPNLKAHSAPGSAGVALRIDSLLKLPLALERHVIRAAAERAGLTLDFKHIEAVRRLASSDAGTKPRRLALPGGSAEVVIGSFVGSSRAAGPGVRELMLRGDSLNKAAQKDYEYRLPVPGCVRISEIGGSIRARLVTVQNAQVAAQERGESAFESYNQPKLPPFLKPGRLLDPRRVGAELTVRNWRPGDRFWPAHTRSPKKIKELLQKVAEAERKSWPVILSGHEIIWMRGFPPPDDFSLPADAPREAEGLLVDELVDE